VDQQSIGVLDLEVVGIGGIEFDYAAPERIIHYYSQGFLEKCGFVLQFFRHREILKRKSNGSLTAGEVPWLTWRSTCAACLQQLSATFTVSALSFQSARPHHTASALILNKDIVVKVTFFWHRKVLLFGTAFVLSACSMGPQVTTTQEVVDATDAPYKKILVVTLFSTFDPRAYLEKEVVLKLAEQGTDAVASTSMMDSRTPVTRETFLAMMEEIGADAVLVTQLASLETKGKIKNMRPRLTVNFRPTYYYDVFSVETTEYQEPQGVELQHSLVLVTEIFSVLQRKGVWAIESKSRIVFDHDQIQDYSIYVDEADAIARSLKRDGLIAR
jgi:hypothetical protein